MDEESTAILRDYWKKRGPAARRKAWLEVEARDGNTQARIELAKLKDQERREKV